MQVFFIARSVHANGLRHLTERRVRFVLRRKVWMVPRAEVQLSDVNGPLGGADKALPGGTAHRRRWAGVVSSLARDWRTALDNALARAARFLLRLWRRSTDSRRLRQRLIHHER